MSGVISTRQIGNVRARNAWTPSTVNVANTAKTHHGVCCRTAMTVDINVPLLTHRFDIAWYFKVPQPRYLEPAGTNVNRFYGCGEKTARLMRSQNRDRRARPVGVSPQSRPVQFFFCRTSNQTARLMISPL